MAKVRKRVWSNAKGEQTAWVADYLDQNKKRHIKTFATKREATAWLAAKIEVRQGTHTPERTSLTVAEAGRLWIEQAETDELEASTIRQYRQHLDLHIKPQIGSIKLVELGRGTVKDFRNTLIAKGRSQVMAKKVLSSLGAILADAMDGGRVARNVVREQAQARSRRKQTEKRHKKELQEGVDFPTKDEIRAMLAAGRGRVRALVVTAIFTGLRASELRGLSWEDVELDRAVLTVRQRADRWNTIGSPKSDAGKREVPLAPTVVNTLKEWRLACPKGTLGLVFPNSKGNVETLPSIHNRALAPLQKAASIVSPHKGGPKYGMHSLRHVAASLFIEQGFTPKRVQALMGHSTIQTTFDVYGHLFKSPEGDQKAFADMQTRLIG
jgi:integrase